MSLPGLSLKSGRNILPPVLSAAGASRALPLRFAHLASPDKPFEQFEREKDVFKGTITKGTSPKSPAKKTGSSGKLARMWGSMMALLGASSGMAHATTPPGDLPDLPFRQFQQIVPVRFEATALTNEEQQRYQAMADAWQQAETTGFFDAARPAQISNLQSQWNQLLAQAQQGQKSAQRILYKLYEDQLFNEIKKPSAQLIRFDYVGHQERLNQWRQGQLSPAKLATEIRWRGVEGLANHLGSQSSSSMSELTQRFYPIVSQVLLEDGNSQVQKWGHSSLQYMFSGMTATQQLETIQRFQASFLSEPAGNTKLFAMKGLATMRMQSTPLNVWQQVIKETETKLQTALQTPEKVADIPYYVVFLGMVQAPDIATQVEALVNPFSTPDTQSAVAWSLGRVSQPQNLTLLKTLIENPRMTPLARELAMYSLENIKASSPQEITDILNAYAADRPEVDNVVEEAARAMVEKQSDTSTTVADFYINKLIPTEAERQSYRSLRSQYVKGLDNLNLAQKNFVDRALIPYRKNLPEIIQRQGKHEIIKGSVTESSQYKYLIGHRIQDGRMWDDVSGVSSTGGAVTSAQVLYPGRFNTFAHEFMHHLHQMVLNNQAGKTQQIVNLFKQGNALDYYAAGDEYEYLGQGGEAYNARFKDHAILYALIFNKGYESTDSHIRSQLKRQDSDLYEFINAIVKPLQSLNAQDTPPPPPAEPAKAS